ncbi:MAG: restriction endonuclease [Rhodocyclales bacterium]|nr:restriction endonuclease [Rhodocyclales bacterium]
MNRPRQPSMAALIEILKTQDDTPRTLDWREFEDHVRQVYQTLLDQKGEKILVARDVTIRGKGGQDHQIDVYYEFELTGLRYQVAIECKNMQRPVEKERVMAFWAKVHDCPGVRGCMVAANGYQSGARQFAEDNGIKALTLAELPSISKLLGISLEMAVVPSEATIGQPFWTIFELETAAPAGHSQDGDMFGVLFLSKRQAQAYLEMQSFGPGWAVRGLSQENLRNYILIVDSMAGRFLLVQIANHGGGNPSVAIQEVPREVLISEYYLGDAPIPAEPMVMPSIAKHRSNRN